MLTIGEHGKHSEGKSQAVANWADKKAKRDSEPRVGCDLEEDIESEEDSENELSKEYRHIQRHLVPKTKNGLEDIIAFRQKWDAPDRRWKRDKYLQAVHVAVHTARNT